MPFKGAEDDRRRISVAVRVSQGAIMALPYALTPYSGTCEGLMCSNLVKVVWVQWILLVFNLMESHQKLHKLYGVLFSFLDYQELVQ